MALHSLLLSPPSVTPITPSIICPQVYSERQVRPSTTLPSFLPSPQPLGTGHWLSVGPTVGETSSSKPTPLLVLGSWTRF